MCKLAIIIQLNDKKNYLYYQNNLVKIYNLVIIKNIKGEIIMIRLCTDSCVDINKNQLEDNNITVFPLLIILGDKEYMDGVDIQPSQIFEYVEKTGQLPKTAARSIEDFKNFFLDLLKDGDEVIYMGISSKLSSAYNYAMAAKDEIKSSKLHIIDSKSLSSGIGLLVLYASELIKQGFSCQEVCQKVESQTNLNQTSFVVDKLDYLYKGGRCSAMARFGANLLKIKPRLELVDGKIENTGKYMGKFNSVIYKYIDDILEKHNKIKKNLCFITHTCKDATLVEHIVNYVQEKGIFENVVSSVAGSTISCHCGENTLGILYLLEE